MSDFFLSDLRNEAKMKKTSQLENDKHYYNKLEIGTLTYYDFKNFGLKKSDPLLKISA